MQLNNTQTGEIIRLVNSNHTGIAYDKFDNGMPNSNSIRQGTQSTINESEVPSEPMSISQLREKLSYDILANENPNFVISEDTRNWAITTGSEGNPTTVRLLLTSELIAKNAYTSSPMGQLMTALSPLRVFSTESNGNIVQYLEEILDVPVIDGMTPIEILNMYNVQIEYK